MYGRKKSAHEPRKGFFQQLPKKAVVSDSIKVTEQYECMASLWVPNIPYSSNAPGIAFTLRHGYGEASQYFRLIFKEESALRVFAENLNRFLVEKLPHIGVEHREAVGEWIEAQAKRQNSVVDGKIDEARKRVFS